MKKLKSKFKPLEPIYPNTLKELIMENPYSESYEEYQRKNDMCKVFQDGYAEGFEGGEYLGMMKKKKQSEIKDSLNSLLNVAFWCSGIVFGICVVMESIPLTLFSGALSLIIAAVQGVFE